VFLQEPYALIHTQVILRSLPLSLSCKHLVDNVFWWLPRFSCTNRNSQKPARCATDYAYHDYRAATHCNTLQHSATPCNTLRHPATPCNILQHTAMHSNTLQRTMHNMTIELQHTATHCNTLQRTAIHCNGLCIT